MGGGEKPPQNYGLSSRAFATKLSLELILLKCSCLHAPIGNHILRSVGPRSKGLLTCWPVRNLSALIAGSALSSRMIRRISAALELYFVIAPRNGPNGRGFATTYLRKYPALKIVAAESSPTRGSMGTSTWKITGGSSRTSKTDDWLGSSLLSRPAMN